MIDELVPEAPLRTVASDGGDGGVAARRAVWRWAWRLFRREWRQQYLVMALLTAAVAATVLAGPIGTNTPPPPGTGFGTADHLVQLSGSDPNRAADIAAVRQGFGTVDVIENQPIATGLVTGAQLRAQDPAGPYGRPMLTLLSGRYPTGAGEVAMTRELASTLGLRTGDVWQQAGQARRVVGMVENPQNLLDNFALVAPGQLAAPGQVTVLFDATARSLATVRLPRGITPVAPTRPQGLDPAYIIFFLALFGLVFVGLVAVAGFSVLAQRRTRALGMLASLGATDRNVRLVLIANGAVVGGVSAVAGTAIGLAAWFGYEPRLEVSAHHRIDRAAVPWWLVVATVLLAVATAVLAARRPARAAARLSVVTSLSGRAAAPKPVHRSALPGAVTLVAGLVMLAFSGGWGGKTLLQLGGLLATSIGLLLLAPVCVAALGALAGRTPVAVRLALRDLARYRTRSGAALAAVSFAVLIAVVISLLATGRYADPLDYFGPNLPANQMLVYVQSSAPGDHAGPQKSQVQKPATDPTATANSIATTLGSADVLALEVVDIGLVERSGQSMRGYGGNVYLATPEVLRHYGIDPASIDPDTVFITSRRGLPTAPNLGVLAGGAGPDSTMAPNPKIQAFAALPTGTSQPNLLVTQHAVDTFHLQPRPGAWLIQAPRPLLAAQINAARQVALAAGLTIETRSQSPSLAQVRNFATAAGIVLALGVLAMTVGLIRNEAARDLRTLAATGAGGGTRRRITGATAGTLGLLGALLGTAVGYLATLALFHGELHERMSQVPVLDLVLIVVGMPAVAAIGSWLLAGREPSGIARQAIE